MAKTEAENRLSKLTEAGLVQRCEPIALVTQLPARQAEPNPDGPKGGRFRQDRL
jgi:hypothetical protein